MNGRLFALGAGMVCVLAILIFVLYLQATSKPAWDGTYRCDPGGTYTTEECP